jgi:hypothetical protein
MWLIKELGLFAVGAVLLLVLTIAGFWGVAEIHIWALNPGTCWQDRRAELHLKDSLELDILGAIYERDTSKSIKYDSLLIRRSSYYTD